MIDHVVFSTNPTVVVSFAVCRIHLSWRSLIARDHHWITKVVLPHPVVVFKVEFIELPVGFGYRCLGGPGNARAIVIRGIGMVDFSARIPRILDVNVPTIARGIPFCAPQTIRLPSHSVVNLSYLQIAVHSTPNTD